MDRLFTINLDEKVVEQIDKTAKRLGKTRIEVANVIISHILKNLQAEKSNELLDQQIRLFDNSKINIDQ
jgi:hypothetical protein